MIHINEVPKAKRLKTISNKTNVLYIVPIIFGFLLIMLSNSILKLFGMAIIFFSVIAFSKQERRSVATIYEDFILIHNRNNEKRVILVKWSDIVDWHIVDGLGAEDQLIIETKNNESFYILMFGVSKLDVYFRNFVQNIKEEGN